MKKSLNLRTIVLLLAASNLPGTMHYVSLTSSNPTQANYTITNA
jgi:hypothetical protein